MAKVRKGNRELTVEEHKVDEFLSQGYDYIDEEGAVLKKGAPISLQDYKECYVACQKEIKDKDEKIIQLEAQLEQKNMIIEDLKKQIEDSEKSSVKDTPKRTASK